MKETQRQEEKLARYNSALNLLFYEGQISWQMNLLFIGLNVGICTVISEPISCICTNEALILAFAIPGLIINIAWLGTFKRNNRYYKLRMAQARHAEPKKWKLLRTDGYKFSIGDEVFIDTAGIPEKEKRHKLSRFEKMATNKNAIQLAIYLFIGGFVTLIAFSAYYMITNQLLCKYLNT